MQKIVGKGKALVLRLYREVLKFGIVGLLSFVIDFGLNVWALTTESPFHDSHVKARIFSGVVATLFSWFANRYWTFRHRKTDQPWKEFVLFLILNGIGLLIAAACVWFANYVLGLKDNTASLIAGQVVGTILGTIFRYFTYRTFVFKEDPNAKEDEKEIVQELKEVNKKETSAAKNEIKNKISGKKTAKKFTPINTKNKK